MTLIQIIQKEIQEGRLKEPFKPADLKTLISANYSGRFSVNTLNVYLPNNARMISGKMGAQVRNNAPLFIQDHEKSYSINKEIKSRSIKNEKRTTKERKEEKITLNTSTGCSLKEKKEIAKSFVIYLRGKPFRLFRYLDSAALSHTRSPWYPEYPATGWLNRLLAYNWDKLNWSKTSHIINTIEEKIKSYRESPNRKPSEALDIYNQIRDFGNPRGSERSENNFFAIFENFLNDNIISSVDSTLTKVYAIAKPDDYVIYDSRVATAIISIAEDIFRVTTKGEDTAKTEFRKCFPNIGIFDGASSSGTRPRGVRRTAHWPNAYKSVNAQLEANELCKLIRDELLDLHEDNKSDWTLREVEAVLFMEGY